MSLDNASHARASVFARPITTELLLPCHPPPTSCRVSGSFPTASLLTIRQQGRVMQASLVPVILLSSISAKTVVSEAISCFSPGVAEESQDGPIASAPFTTG
ncbi:hypothetical protein J6590_008380, partial [Homalodisca vitripennis]